MQATCNTLPPAPLQQAESLYQGVAAWLSLPDGSVIPPRLLRAYTGTLDGDVHTSDSSAAQCTEPSQSTLAWALLELGVHDSDDAPSGAAMRLRLCEALGALLAAEQGPLEQLVVSMMGGRQGTTAMAAALVLRAALGSIDGAGVWGHEPAAAVCCSARTMCVLLRCMCACAHVHCPS